MKHLILSFSFLFSINFADAQSLEVFGGYLHNLPYEFPPKEYDAHEKLSLYDDGGFSFGVAIDHLWKSKMPQRVTLRYEEYSTGFNYSGGGKGSGFGISGTLKKSYLNVGYFPIGNQSKNNFRFNLGLEFGYLLSQEAVRDRPYYVDGQPIFDIEDEIGSQVSLGISTMFSYQIEIVNGWYVVPHARLYIGLLNEFDYAEMNARAFRVYFELGIMKDLFDRDAFKASRSQKSVD